MTAAAPTLDAVLAVLREIAPLELAAEWDNVGLLVEPRGRRRRVARIVLTIDLTTAVAEEAERLGADLVVAYHPAIFRPLRRLDVADGKQAAVLRAAAAGFAVWSPHTALDAVAGGIADWLADGVLAGTTPRHRDTCGEGGYGRVVELARPLPFATLLRRVRAWLGVRHLQVARPEGRRSAVRRVAVAAGSGAGVLGDAEVDAFVTGEMSHHEALALTAAGTSVVLAGHSNTERGYLRLLRGRLRKGLGGGVDVRIAKRDRDPFQFV